MVIQIREEREQGQRAKYQYALISAQAIYYELRELGISPLPSPRTIHDWLKDAGHIPERRSQKASNPTYPILPCQAVNDVQELDFKGPFYLQDHSQVLPGGSARQTEQENRSAGSGKQEYGRHFGLFGVCLAKHGLSETPENG